MSADTLRLDPFLTTAIKWVLIDLNNKIIIKIYSHNYFKSIVSNSSMCFASLCSLHVTAITDSQNDEYIQSP